MYNRYTLQQDGSYRRKTIHDTTPMPSPERIPGSDCRTFNPGEDVPILLPPASPLPEKPSKDTNHRSEKPDKNRPPKNAGGFLRDLIPKDLDMGDLLVVILLLLICADNSDDQGTALLTLALYFIM